MKAYIENVFLILDMGDRMRNKYMVEVKYTNNAVDKDRLFHILANVILKEEERREEYENDNSNESQYG